jgi:hypothetical protein
MIGDYSWYLHIGICCSLLPKRSWRMEYKTCFCSFFSPPLIWFDVIKELEFYFLKRPCRVMFSTKFLCAYSFHYMTYFDFHRMQVKSSNQPVIVVLPLNHTDGLYSYSIGPTIYSTILHLDHITWLGILFVTDTESARASRKQYKETIFSVLFDMDVPAVCAVDQVCVNAFFDYWL